MANGPSPPPSSHGSDNGSDQTDDVQHEVQSISNLNASPNPKPKDYKMGIWTRLTPGSEWFIIAGGKPLADWSGLDPTEDQVSRSPLQIRQVSQKTRSADYKNRIAPMAIKFKQGMNLREFMEEVATHNDEHGLSTWHYLHDPSDTTKMLSVISSYTKFIDDVEDTVERALKLSSEHYDEFDLENSKAGATYLINSLDPEFKSYIKIMMVANEEHNFICVWVRILSKVLSNSSKSVEQTKARIRSLLPSSFEKEDISKWHKSLIVQIESLQSSNSYDQSLTEAILENAAQHCSVKDGFNFFIYQLLHKLKPVLKRVKHNHDLIAQEREMVRHQLDIKTILRCVVGRYTELKSDGNWPPAKLPTDRHALRQKGAYLAITDQSVVKDIAKEVAANLALSQNPTKPKKKGSCHNCGDPDHWANECPHPLKRKDGLRGKKLKPSYRKPGWVRTPPTQGGKETRKWGQTTYYWCAKCRSWNLTHSTAEHVPRRPVGSDGPVTSPRADLALASECEMHPAIWAAITRPDSPIVLRRSDDDSDNEEDLHVDPPPARSVNPLRRLMEDSTDESDSERSDDHLGFSDCPQCGNRGLAGERCYKCKTIFPKYDSSDDEASLIETQWKRTTKLPKIPKKLGSCNCCGKSGTYLLYCACGGQFGAIPIAEDDLAECAECQPSHLSKAPKRKMTVKCVKCGEFKPSTDFKFKRAENGSKLTVDVRIDMPIPRKKTKKHNDTASRYISRSTEESEFVNDLHDNEKAAQLDLKPAANAVSSNFSTNSNANFDNYTPLLDLICFLLPFISLVTMCYHLRSFLPIYGGASFSLCTTVIKLLPSIRTMFYAMTAPY